MLNDSQDPNSHSSSRCRVSSDRFNKVDAIHASLGFLCRLCPLLHLEPQQAGLGAADCGSIIAIFLIKGMTAVVESIDELAAFCFVKVVLGEAVCSSFSLVRAGDA